VADLRIARTGMRSSKIQYETLREGAFLGYPARPMSGRSHSAFARRIGALLALCLGLLTASAAPASADEIAWMYDPDAVVEIHLGGLSEEELDALEAEPGEEQKGTFELTVDGVAKGPLLNDVGIRLKGGTGSGRPIKTGKSGLKIRFDKFVKNQLFFGVKRLTLNNMIQDPSMVHETLSYELFHALGLPASRSGYAFVTLNGDAYGLFLNLETLDEVSLPQWFDTTGHLYEADAPKTDLRPGEAETFEVDEGDDEDLGDLEALIAAVNDEEGDWSDGVEAVADLERLADQWAVERYIAHWDGYAGLPGVFRPNNYYLHSDAAGVFQMMPWGADQTWERDDTWFEGDAGGLMFNKCIEDADCLALYRQGLTKVHCAVPELEHGSHVAALAAMLRPYQDLEDEARRESTPEEIAAEVESVEEFADLRAAQLADHLAQLGMLGAGTGPCGLPPGPGKPTEPVMTSPGDPVPPIGLPRRKLAFGPSRVLGTFVTTRVEVPGPGTVKQWVSARLDGRWRRVCSDTHVRAGAGSMTIRCRLAATAREALQYGPLKLRVRVGFDSRSVLRVLTAPKQS
jgi:CotH kinase protein